MSAAIPVSLETLLRRPDLWRGDRLAVAPCPGVASGFAALDAELPGGGWPRGTLIELLPAQPGIGELALLRPALARLAGERPLVLVAPPWRPHAPAWAAALPGARLWVVEAAGRDAAWSAELLLASGAAAVLAWLPQIDSRGLRRLQVACEGRRGLSWLFRPPSAAAQASPAPLRLQLEAAPAGLGVRILKRRGPPCGRPLHLALERPGLAPRPRALPQRQTDHALAGAQVA